MPTPLSPKIVSTNEASDIDRSDSQEGEARRAKNMAKQNPTVGKTFG
jgi:hypothetical protein